MGVATCLRLTSSHGARGDGGLGRRWVDGDDTVGTFGSTGSRCADVTASGTIAPLRTCGVSRATVAIDTGTWPATER